MHNPPDAHRAFLAPPAQGLVLCVLVSPASPRHKGTPLTIVNRLGSREEILTTSREIAGRRRRCAARVSGVYKTIAYGRRHWSIRAVCPGIQHARLRRFPTSLGQGLGTRDGLLPTWMLCMSASNHPRPTTKLRTQKGGLTQNRSPSCSARQQAHSAHCQQISRPTLRVKSRSAVASG